MICKLIPEFPVRFFSKCVKIVHKPLCAPNNNYSTKPALQEEIIIPEWQTKIGRFNINFTQVGSGDHVILGLPGVFGTIEKDFQPIISRLNKERFTMVTWDAPGFGKSRLTSGQGFRKMTREIFTEDAQMAVQLMKDLGFDRFSILGWSRGAVTGVHLINAHPEKIKKLFIWGSPAYTDEQSVIVATNTCKMDLWPRELIQPLLDEYGEQTLQDMLNDFKEYVTTSYRTGSFQMGPILSKMPPIPTLIIHGQNDMSTSPAHAQVYHEKIPNSKLEIWKNASHFLHLEHSDKFVKRIERFLHFDK